MATDPVFRRGGSHFGFHCHTLAPTTHTRAPHHTTHTLRGGSIQSSAPIVPPPDGGVVLCVLLSSLDYLKLYRWLLTLGGDAFSGFSFYHFFWIFIYLLHKTNRITYREVSNDQDTILFTYFVIHDWCWFTGMRYIYFPLDLLLFCFTFSRHQNGTIFVCTSKLFLENIFVVRWELLLLFKRQFCPGKKINAFNAVAAQPVRL